MLQFLNDVFWWTGCAFWSLFIAMNLIRIYVMFEMIQRDIWLYKNRELSSHIVKILRERGAPDHVNPKNFILVSTIIGRITGLILFRPFYYSDPMWKNEDGSDPNFSPMSDVDKV